MALKKIVTVRKTTMSLSTGLNLKAGLKAELAAKLKAGLKAKLKAGLKAELSAKLREPAVILAAIKDEANCI